MSPQWINYWSIKWPQNAYCIGYQIYLNLLPKSSWVCLILELSKPQVIYKMSRTLILVHYITPSSTIQFKSRNIWLAIWETLEVYPNTRTAGKHLNHFLDLAHYTWSVLVWKNEFAEISNTRSRSCSVINALPYSTCSLSTIDDGPTAEFTLLTTLTCEEFTDCD